MSERRQCPCTDIILAVDKFSERVNLNALSKATGPSIQISPNLQLTSGENATLLNKFWGIYQKYQEYFSLIPKDLVTLIL